MSKYLSNERKLFSLSKFTFERRNEIKNFLFIIILFFCCIPNSNAQNCTANAGGDHIVCGTTTTLRGSVNGLLDTLNTPLWTFVSGPTTPIIESPNTLTTNVSGMIENGVYTFQLTRNCETGVAISYVNVTARPRPIDFTAGPDILDVCAVDGEVVLAGHIPSGYTGVWNSINIFNYERYSNSVSTNSSFSNTTISNPTFSLINKSNHQTDPSYYAVLNITSEDGICSYKDTAIVRFKPNVHINLPSVYNSCIDDETSGHYFYLDGGINSGPYFANSYP